MILIQFGFPAFIPFFASFCLLNCDPWICSLAIYSLLHMFLFFFLFSVCICVWSRSIMLGFLSECLYDPELDSNDSGPLTHFLVWISWYFDGLDVCSKNLAAIFSVFWMGGLACNASLLFFWELFFFFIITVKIHFDASNPVYYPVLHLFAYNSLEIQGLLLEAILYCTCSTSIAYNSMHSHQWELESLKHL